MKKISFYLFIILFLSLYTFVNADYQDNLNWQDKILKQDKEEISSWKVNSLENNKSDNKEKDSEQKNGTWILKKEEKDTIVKNLNTILIETYKAKFAKILSDLNENIKEKKKDEKLKIFSTVILSISDKIKLINSDKVDVSENRKEILIAVLKYIKQDVELKMQSISKEK